MQAEFLQASYLKKTTAQASSLKVGEKVSVGDGERINIVDWRSADAGHLRLTLKVPINNETHWFVFAPHVQLIDNAGELINDIAPDPETAPQFERGDAPEPPVEPKPGRPETFVMLPGKRRVNLYAPIAPDTPNFFWYEALHGGDRIPKRQDEVDAIVRIARSLQALRNKIGKPFRITSWYRPEPFNSRAGGARRSQHLGGGAADIAVEGMLGREVAAIAVNLKIGNRYAFGGVGIYPGDRRHICHLDVRGTRARWGF